MQYKQLVAILSVVSVVLASVLAGAVDAQSPSVTTTTTTTTYRDTISSLSRAKNYARQVAEKINGGLQVYRAEAMMHGPVEETHYVENSDGTVTFTFYGGRPGFTTPTVESVVTVNMTTGETHVDYNGEIH